MSCEDDALPRIDKVGMERGWMLVTRAPEDRAAARLVKVAMAGAFCLLGALPESRAQTPAPEQQGTPPQPPAQQTPAAGPAPAEPQAAPAVPQGPAPTAAPAAGGPKSTALPTVAVQAQRRRAQRRATAAPAAPAARPQPRVTTAAPAPAQPPSAVATGGGPGVGGTGGTAANGYLAKSAGNVGPFANVNLQDTPYSVSVTPGALFENNNAHTESEALKTNPTVVPLIESNGPSASLSRIQIRGFTAADQDELRDGITDRSFTFPPLENVDHIEVLNGPSGFLYGFSEPGGTVNYVSKQPTATPFATLSSGIYGGAIGFVHGDAGGLVDAEGRWRYRVDLYQEDGDTYIDHGTQQRTLFSGITTYQLGENSTIALDYYHQDYKVTGIRVDFAPYVLNGVSIVPSAFNASKQYGQPWTNNTSEKDVLGTKFVSELDDVFTFRSAVRYASMWRDNTYIDGILTDAIGDYKEQTTMTTRQHETTWGGYTLMDANFDAASLHHLITFGYTDSYYYYTRGPNVTTQLGATNVDAPASFPEPNVVIPGDSNFQAQNLGNVVLGDRVTFNQYWSALVGVNDARVNQTGGGINGPASSVLGTPVYNQDKVTPNTSLMFKPVSWATLYGTFIEALELGDQAPDTTNGIPVVNAGAVLAPSASTEYEAGVKMDFGRYFLSTAFFNINKVNAEVNPATNYYIQDGREVHQGIEVIGKGKITDQLTFVGGFTLMQARVDEATALPASNGKIPINVPEAQARGYFEYALPQSLASGVTLVTGANYYGRRPVDALNTGFMPAATTFDVGLRYEPVVFGRKLAFNLTVSNLFNEAYWASYNTGMLLGAPRIIAFSGKVPLW
jgi:iron complex outermembrane recepter protein